MLKGIVFDLDGTLINSLGLTFDAINHATKTLTNLEFTPPEIMKFFGLGEGKIIAGLIGTEHESKGYDLYRSFVANSMNRVALFEGALDVLTQIRNKGLPLAIFTGRSEPTTNLILEHHQIKDWFNLIITDDHVDEPKPAPEGLFKISKHLNIPTENLLFIGDTSVDIKAAKSGGSKSAAATWDHLFKHDEMKKLSPDYWLKDIRDILNLL